MAEGSGGAALWDAYHDVSRLAASLRPTEAARSAAEKDGK